jgi:hypothetical protein
MASQFPVAELDRHQMQTGYFTIKMQQLHKKMNRSQHIETFKQG